MVALLTSNRVCDSLMSAMQVSRMLLNNNFLIRLFRKMTVLILWCVTDSSFVPLLVTSFCSKCGILHQIIHMVGLKKQEAFKSFSHSKKW